MPENSERLPDEDDNDLAEEELLELSRRFDQLEEECNELHASTVTEMDRLWRELAGAKYFSMLRSKKETLKEISNPDPNIRQVAVYLAFDRWLMVGEYAAKYEYIALHDSDPNVRAVAFLALGVCFAKSRDRRVGGILAEVVCDEKLPDNLRTHALAALLELDGQHRSDNSHFELSLGVADWDLVRKYATSGT